MMSHSDAIAVSTVNGGEIWELHESAENSRKREKVELKLRSSPLRKF
jgi:hypothetical protein